MNTVAASGIFSVHCKGKCEPMQSLIRSLGKVREGHSHQWRVQGRAPPPTYFWTKLRPEGRKKNFAPPPHPPHLSKGLDDRQPPPPTPPHLKVWIQHWSWCKKMTLFKVSHKFRPISETMFGAISKLRAKTSGDFVAICPSVLVTVCGTCCNFSTIYLTFFARVRYPKQSSR